MAAALERLRADDENWRVWGLFRQVVTRFAMDAHLVGPAFERLTQDLDPEQYADTLDRFTVLYDTLYPPPPKTTTER